MGSIVITGANRGIGLELARLGARRGQVIGLCRHGSAALSALGARVEEGVEITDDASVRAAADRLGDLTVDVLILNAGILQRETFPALDFDSIRAQLEVNALGPLRVAAALSSRLREGSKIAIVTSRMGSIADNTSGGRYGYRMSKAAVNMAGVSLAHDLRPRGVAVALLHPGFVRTDMTGRNGDVDADVAAARLWDRIDALTLETSGGFWHADGTPLPW